MANGWYRRTIDVGDRLGWAAIGTGLQSDTVQVLISKSLGPVLSLVLSRLKAMLDAWAEPIEVSNHLSADPLLAPLLDQCPGPRIPGAFDGFECGIRAILGQQMSVRAATTLAGRLANRFGRQILLPNEALTTLFPDSVALATASVADLCSLGLTTRRAQTIKSFATTVEEGKVILDPGADPERVRASLLAIPGIGDWTVEYILMRSIAWPDAFPARDLGLIKASGLTAAELRARSERWRPWRSYAAILLWQSLEASREQPSNGRNR